MRYPHRDLKGGCKYISRYARVHIRERSAKKKAGVTTQKYLEKDLERAASGTAEGSTTQNWIKTNDIWL